MKKSVISTSSDQLSSSGSTMPEFKGYTIDQILYQRALVSIKKDFYKERMINNFQEISNVTFLRKSNSKNRKNISRKLGSKSILSKILKSLDIIDYAMIGASAYQSISNFIGFFKKNKKS